MENQTDFSCLEIFLICLIMGLEIRDGENGTVMKITVLVQIHKRPEHNLCNIYTVQVVNYPSRICHEPEQNQYKLDCQ